MEEKSAAILIVDDDTSMTSNLQDILEAEGYSVAVAPDAETALNLCRQKVFDLGLIDMRLPGMSGLELAKKLSELLPRVEYIIITGYASLESAIDAVGRRNLVAYVTKPLNMDHLLALIRQVSERRRVEEELKRGEENFRRSLDDSPLGIRIVNSDGQTTYANQAMLDIYGYASVEEFKATPIKKRYTAASYAEHQIRKGKRQRGEYIPSNYEIDIVRNDGEIRHLEVFRKEVLWNGHTQLQVLYQDITGRKQDEERLRESEEFSSSLLTNSPNPIIVINPDTSLRYVNPAVENLTGFTSAELVGRKTPYPWWPEEAKEEISKDFKSLLYMGTWQFERLFQKKNGERFWVEIDGIPVIRNGELKYRLTNWVDITERKRMEEEGQRNYDTQAILNALLKVSLEGLPLEKIMQRSLELVLSIPWLTLEQRGAILLVEGEPNVLVMKAQSKLAEPIQKACAQVPFGRCLCGRAALTNETQFADRIDDRHETRYESIIPHGHYCVPITFGGEMLGVMNTYTKEGHRRDKREEAFLTAVANALAGIIKRKQAEQALIDSEKFNSSLLSNSPNPILVINPDTSIRYINPAFEAMTSFTPAELIGVKSPYPWWPEEALEANSSNFKVWMHTGVKHLERFFQKKNGERFWIELNSTTLISDREIKYHLVNWTDITQRKQAEEMFKSVVVNSPVGVYIVQKGKFVYTNPQFQKDTGYSEDELLGMESLSLVTHEDREIVRGKAIQMLKEKNIAPYEYRITNRRGETRWASETVAPIHYRGKRATIGNYQDITDRKNIQEQLIITDRLASIGQLTAGIAHELNNPLTSVIGFSDLLLEKDLPKDVKEDLEIINREAIRTANVVKGLLTFSRKQGTKKEPVDISSIIQGVLQIRSYEQRVNNIEVNTQFAPELPEVLGNGAQLQQVFINLVVNAEQAMLEAHGRGRLTITTERVRDIVRASIADDGPGISPENFRRLFTPFFTTKEVGKGTGLGLSICHGIVTEHGGKIYAESEPGKGANFILELPIP